MEPSKIAFQVETQRVLEILSKEIYDSPYALLRENIQNAYDAILMRSKVDEFDKDTEGLIEVVLSGAEVSISDNGIGMTEEVIEKNFWKAGSSGKNNAAAKEAGVVGTFGIGAMANFGVCSKLSVQTKYIGSKEVIVTSAERESLKLNEKCVDIFKEASESPPGTKVTASLDGKWNLKESEAIKYIEPYVRYLPVAVKFNGKEISKQSYFTSFLARQEAGETEFSVPINDAVYKFDAKILVSKQGQTATLISNLKVHDIAVSGEAILVQGQSHVFGLRNYFGLAPIPVSGVYQLGGVVNLQSLHPTAGREALSRESIEQVNKLVQLVEKAVSEKISETDYADINTNFMQYIVSHGAYQLAKNIKVEIAHGTSKVTLGELEKLRGGRKYYFYTGRDEQIIQSFNAESANLILIGQTNPRRQIQVHYLKTVLQIEEVSDAPQVVKEVDDIQLTLSEASLAVKVATVMTEDYLLPHVLVKYAQLSHGSSFLVKHGKDKVTVFLAQNSASITHLIECRNSAYEIFGDLVKDFVRVRLYPLFANVVPSSTRLGVDALQKILKKNRELFSYEYSEMGDMTGLLSDYLSGKADFAHVLQQAASHANAQTQRVSVEQVGSVESEIPGITNQQVDQPSQKNEGGNFSLEAVPPILRRTVESKMKILTVGSAYSNLNNFLMFISLSEKIFKYDLDFFLQPHTTKVIWGTHRVIFIFGHVSGRLTLYYDLELKTPIDNVQPGGAAVPTTTIVTKDKIYIPIPGELLPSFIITSGTKEFFVRYDLIPGK